MAEQRIIIIIDDNGEINASTNGIKGEMCITEVKELLGEAEEIQTLKKTDDYFQSEKVKNINKIKSNQK